MNENPDGTPNPLNPTPMEPIGPEEPVEPMAAGSVEQEQPMMPEETAMPEEMAEQPMEPMAEQPIEEVAMAETIEVNQPMDEPVPMDGPAPVSEPIPVAPETIEPEPKDSIVEPKKKSSKKPIIILAIIFLLIAIGCGVAAIVLLNPFGKKEDAVPAAISKLITNAPTNVNINGSVVMSGDGSASEFLQSVAVDFSSRMNAKTTENATSATITITATDDSELTFEAEEIFTSNGDLYLKVSGIADAIYPTDCVDDNTDCVTELEEETNCVGDESGETNCTVVEDDCDGDDCEEAVVGDGLAEIFALLTILDDKWIKLSSDELNAMISTTETNATTQCLIDAAGKLGDYSDDIKGLYNENPFVEYSTDNITVTKKKDTIYRLSFNSDKMAAFVNSMKTSGFANELKACTGETATNTDVSAESMANVVKNLPETYVEIDKDNNFTRVYLKAQSEDGKQFATADLSFSYPTTNVTVEEPTNYTDFNTLLVQLFSQSYVYDTDDYVIEYDY